MRVVGNIVRKWIKDLDKQKRWVMCGLALCFLAGMMCTACRKQTTATVISLFKTEGSVDIVDQKGKEIPPKENLRLFDGYCMGTWKQSYLWADLDKSRRIKMDEESQAEIEKAGKNLEIVVSQGSLFFHIAEPLEDDETLNIRTSSMIVGIRGTCGWVEVKDAEHMWVFLLEGTVECSIHDPESGETRTALVSGGEKAELVASAQESDIRVEELYWEEIPDFVMREIQENDELKKEIEHQEDGGWEENIENESGVLPASTWKSSYEDLIRSADSIDYGITSPNFEPLVNFGYALYDMDKNGIPELLICADNNRRLCFHMYTYKEGEEAVLLYGLTHNIRARFLKGENGLVVYEPDFPAYLVTMEGDEAVEEEIGEFAAEGCPAITFTDYQDLTQLDYVQ